MVSDVKSYLSDRKSFLENRAKFPIEELAKFAGQWVAWKPDGTGIVASALDPDCLEDLVLAAGEDPTRCVVQGIPDDDSVIGGGLCGAEP